MYYTVDELMIHIPCSEALLLAYSVQEQWTTMVIGGGIPLKVTGVNDSGHQKQWAL